MNALESLHDATRKRPAQIHTPQVILDALARIWPEGIALDPCGSPDGIVRADRIVLLPEDGLEVEWPARTFVNPPFGKLKPWLAKWAAADECVLLTPVRTHRKWFREALAEGKVVWLNPIAFLGYVSTFPAPLALLYRGDADLYGACRDLGLTS